MKRNLALLSALLLTLTVSGCGSDSRDDVVNGVITFMDQASSDVGTIKKKISEAVEKSKKDNAVLDLTEAGKAAEKLKETGKFAQQRKREVEAVRADVKEEDKQAFAEKFKGRINDAYSRLVREKKGLNEALLEAEQLDATKTEELRAKIREAEGPFESLARQQG